VSDRRRDRHQALEGVVIGTDTFVVRDDKLGLQTAYIVFV
jgi:hypothetical protein